MRIISAFIVCVALASPASAQQREPIPPDRLTLGGAIAEALKQSPELRSPSDAVTQAGIRRQVAQSQFGLKLSPTFSAGSDTFGFDQSRAGVTLSKRLPIGTSLSITGDMTRYGNEATEFRDGGYHVMLSQPLLRGFATTAAADLKDAQRRTVSSARGLDEARQQLVVAVADAYFAVVKQLRLVEAGERTAQRAAALRSASEARAKVGLATQLDVLRADLLASQAHAGLTLQREELDATLDRLKLLIGRPPDSTVAVDPVDRDPLLSAADAIAARAVEDLVTAAVANRAEVRESRERITDEERRVRIARWNLLPDVALNVSYTRRGIGSPSGAMLHEMLGGWRIGLSTNYSTDAASQAASVATAKIALSAAKQAAVEAEWRIAADVRRAHRAFHRAAQTIAIQQQALELANRQLRLAEIRYERGLAGNFDVIDAESHAFQARTALIAAEIDRSLAALRLQRIVGALDTEELSR